ncbi:MAG: hypothetical protein AB1449_09590 [Chloroflexota bacterium]
MKGPDRQCLTLDPMATLQALILGQMNEDSDVQQLIAAKRAGDGYAVLGRSSCSARLRRGRSVYPNLALL